MAPEYKKLDGAAAELQNLRGKWQPSHAELWVRIIEDLVTRNPHRAPGRLQQVILSLLVLGLLVARVGLFTSQPAPKHVVFFVMLGISAPLGTALRSSLQSIGGAAAPLSWVRIFAETTSGLRLAFGLFLAYAVGGFTATGKWEFVKLPGGDDFLRGSVTLSILGFAPGSSSRTRRSGSAAG